MFRTRVNVKEIGPKQIDKMSEKSFIENFSLACRELFPKSFILLEWRKKLNKTK